MRLIVRNRPVSLPRFISVFPFSRPSERNERDSSWPADFRFLKIYDSATAVFLSLLDPSDDAAPARIRNVKPPGAGGGSRTSTAAPLADGSF